MEKKLNECQDSKGGFAEDRAEKYRRGVSYGEAREKLSNLLGERGVVVLKNDNDGEEARLSKTSIGKLLSNAAVKKSTDNGFTRGQHYAVVSDIDNLFRKSFKLLMRQDSKGNPDVFIHRFATPLHFDDATAYITIKESRQHGGKRVYTAELVEIGRLEGMLEEAGHESLTLHPAPSFHTSNITKLQAAVKKNNKNLSDPPPPGATTR